MTVTTGGKAFDAYQAAASAAVRLQLAKGGGRLAAYLNSVYAMGGDLGPPAGAGSGACDTAGASNATDADKNPPPLQRPPPPLSQISPPTHQDEAKLQQGDEDWPVAAAAMVSGLAVYAIMVTALCALLLVRARAHGLDYIVGGKERKGGGGGVVPTDL